MENLTHYLSLYEIARQIPTFGTWLGIVTNYPSMDEDTKEGQFDVSDDEEEEEKEETDVSRKTKRHPSHAITARWAGGIEVRKSAAGFGRKKRANSHDLEVAQTVTLAKGIAQAMNEIFQLEKYVCNGEASVNTSTDRLYILDKSYRVNPVISSSAVKKLQAECKPAVFGDLRTQTTVHDPNIRSAKESEDIKFSCSALLDIQKEIEDKLHVSIELEPYKLNIYTPGDFFHAHVDTPSDTNMLGTLVIAIPTSEKFTGGSFRLADPTDGGDAHIFELKSDNKYSWVAFFGDCPHAVNPIYGGYRLTYTYRIKGIHGPTINTNIPNELVSQFLSAIETYRQNTKCISMGFILKHRLPGLEFTPDMLRPVDRILYNILTSSYSNVQLQTIAYNPHIVREDDGACQYLENVYSFTTQEIARLRHLPALRAFDHRSNSYSPPSRHDVRERCSQPDTYIHFIGTKKNGYTLYNKYEEGIEYTGNESQPEMDTGIYCSGAIIVRWER